MEKIKEKYFYPMAVAVIFGRKDTKEDIISRWDKFDLLGDVEKNILVSENVPITVKKIATQFGLLPISIEEVSRLIRDVYFGNVLKSDLSHELIRKISSLAVESAQKIAQILNDEIFMIVLSSDGDSEPEKKKSVYIQFKIADALLKYPKLGEQNVTSDQIKLRYFPTPVRPSIKNWITDFHDAMGSMKHSPIDRGNFLFHSENGKSLSSFDRQKLGTILKSLDEQTMLNIDTEMHAVIFENTDKQLPIQSNYEVRNRGFFAKSESENPKKPLSVDTSFVSNENMAGMDSVESQSQQDSHDTFSDSVLTSEVEKTQGKRFQEKLREFFAKPESKNIKNTMPVSNKMKVNPDLQPNEQNNLSKNISFSPNFSAKPKDKQVVNGRNLGNFAGATNSPVVPAPFPIDTVNEKNEVKNDFFQIPQSKPPIGSEHFNANISPKEIGLNTDEKVDAEKKQISSVPNLKSPSQQDPELMSDDLLYEMLQSKSIKHENTNLSGSDASFSSPQKLPAEQSAKSAQPSAWRIQQPKPMSKTNQFPGALPQQPQLSAYHIAPSDYVYEKKDGLPKIQRNVVDLKN